MKRKKILIIDHFEQDTVELRKSLLTFGFEVRIVQKSSEVEAYFNEFLPDLLIVETRLADASLVNLITFIRSKEDKKIVPIVATGNPRTVEERIVVLEREVDDFVYKPFDLDEVLVRLENLLKEAANVSEKTPVTSKGFSGSLSEMTLVDLLQTLEIGKKTGIITLYTGSREGKVYIIEGEAVDAMLDNLDSKDALMRMFTWMDGQFSVEMKKHETAKRLLLSTREIISEGMTRQYRWNQLTKQLPALQTVLNVSQNSQANQLTGDEQQIYNLLNGRKNFVDIVEESAFDDIKALRLLKALYEKGCITKASESRGFLQDEQRQQSSGKPQNGSTPKDYVTKAFSGMFQTPQIDSSPDFNRRRIDRRRVDRRSSDRQRKTVVEENKIVLNKTELIMIREKLLAGLQQKT